MARLKAILEMVEYDSEAEAINAQLLPPQTLAMVKTLLATDTMRLNNLKPDPESYVKFIQEHAEIKGAQMAWQHLINNHEEIVKRLATD